MVKKFELIMSRRGSPKEMFETPRTVFTSANSGVFFRREMPRRVSFASFCWVPQVNVRKSIIISLFLML
jgi:hypothetical protein